MLRIALTSTALLAGASVVVSPAAALAGAASMPSGTRTTCQVHSVRSSYRSNRAAVVRLHGHRAPGRDIRRWGLSTSRPSTCHDLRRSTAVLRRMRMPVRAAQLVTTGRPYVPPAATQTIHAGGTLESIAACESGGNPGAVDSSGTYRGKYQFDARTWQSVGGSGDPAAASEAEQDKRAAILYSQRGAAPWPVCGR